jgi:hypothetical protein
MTVSRSMLALAAFSLLLPVQAQAASGDPEIVIYRFPGVLDNGGAAVTGVATVFHCTNFSGVTETLRFVVRNFNTTIVANLTQSIAHLATATAATHDTAPYAEDLLLATGGVAQGTATIAATSVNVICTAMTIDAANSKPDGVALRGIRFSPGSGKPGITALGSPRRSSDFQSIGMLGGTAAPHPGPCPRLGLAARIGTAAPFNGKAIKYPIGRRALTADWPKTHSIQPAFLRRGWDNACCL